MTDTERTALTVALDDAVKAEALLAGHRLYREAEWCKGLADRLRAVLKGERDEVQG